MTRITDWPNLCRSEAQIQEYFLPKSQRERARRRQGGQPKQQKRQGLEGVESAAAEEAVALNSISEWRHFRILYDYFKNFETHYYYYYYMAALRVDWIRFPWGMGVIMSHCTSPTPSLNPYKLISNRQLYWISSFWIRRTLRWGRFLVKIFNNLTFKSTLG